MGQDRNHSSRRAGRTRTAMTIAISRTYSNACGLRRCVPHRFTRCPLRIPIWPAAAARYGGRWNSSPVRRRRSISCTWAWSGRPYGLTRSRRSCLGGRRCRRGTHRRLSGTAANDPDVSGAQSGSRDLWLTTDASKADALVGLVNGDPEDSGRANAQGSGASSRGSGGRLEVGNGGRVGGAHQDSTCRQSFHNRTTGDSRPCL